MPKIRPKRQRVRIRRDQRKREAAARFREPHTGKQAGKIASAQAGLEFNPVIRQMRSEARGSTRREADIGSWYDQLAADYQTSAAQAADAYKTSEAATTERTQEAGQRGVDALKELAAGDSKLAALVGGPTNAGGLSQMATAQAAADRQRITLAQPNTEAGANALAFLGRRASSARLAGIEGRGRERRARGKITSDLATARREKGAATVTRMEDLRAGDRDYGIQLRAFPLKEKEFAQDARQDAIGNRQERQKIRISRQGAKTSSRNAATSERNAATSEKNAGTSARSQRDTERSRGKDGLTPSQQRDIRQHNRDAMSAAQALLAIKVPKNAKQWAQFETALIDKLGSTYAEEARRAVRKLRQRRASYESRAKAGEVAGPTRP